MPKRPPKPCGWPGCGALVDSGYCEPHRKQHFRQQDEERGTASERGYGAQWRRARLMYLRRNPWCRACERDSGRLTPATVVDHIEPHRGDMGKFWNEANWQPLCVPHHGQKTARESGMPGRHA